MEYFGTSLTQAGHYRWQINEHGLSGSNLRFYDLPFEPEGLIRSSLREGDIIYYQGGGITAIGICGSPADRRPGSKSIFWDRGAYTIEQMKEHILKNSVAKKIIDALPFEVQW